MKSVMVLAAFVAVCVSYAASQMQAPRKAKETIGSYTRPKPSKPVAPQIQNLDRSRPDRFFLEQADVLYAVDNDSTGRQIVSGNVVFRKQGMRMYCDSAYYYPATSSLEAFGNVRMVQGDTIKVEADYANYDGFTEQAQLQARGTGREVSLEHISRGDRTVKTLRTDVLDYNLITGEASYRTGGTMFNRSLADSRTDTLTSRMGTYNTGTRLAEVLENVYLRNSRSRLRTERLLYHADTRMVELVELATISSGADSIMTTQGRYHTAAGNAVLTGRSLITHRDTAGNVTTLEGDSILYDRLTHTSEAFMFTDPAKRPAPMIITDTARHAVLIGGYGFYNDSTRTAYAERYPLLKEYSRPDTIFLRAEKVMLLTLTPGDTTRSATATDSLPRQQQQHHIAKAFNRARFFRTDIQGIADSITFVSRDSMLYLNRKPIVWSGNRLVSGSRIEVHFNDSTPDRALLPRKGIVAEAIEQGFYNQLRAGHILAHFTPAGDLESIHAHTDVQTIFLPQEKDSTFNKLVNAVGDTLSVNMTGREMQKLKLWSRTGAKVSGNVTPLMSVTYRQYYLPDFITMAGAQRFSEMDSVLSRLDKLRPTYSIYSHGWSDDLGELSFELDDYFSNASMGIIDDTPILPSIPPATLPVKEPAATPASGTSGNSTAEDEQPDTSGQ